MVVQYCCYPEVLLVFCCSDLKFPCHVPSVGTYPYLFILLGDYWACQNVRQRPTLLTTDCLTGIKRRNSMWLMLQTVSPDCDRVRWLRGDFLHSSIRYGGLNNYLQVRQISCRCTLAGVECAVELISQILNVLFDWSINCQPNSATPSSSRSTSSVLTIRGPASNSGRVISLVGIMQIYSRSDRWVINHLFINPI